MCLCRSTAKAATELRAIITRSTGLVATIAAAVVSEATRRSVTTWRTTIPFKRSSGLLQRGRNNLRGKAEVFTQELNSRISQEPVVMAPCISLRDVLL